MDKWLLSRLGKMVKEATEFYKEYNIPEARRSIETFFWHDFCDNYLEIIKERIYNVEKRGKEAKVSAQYTLYQSLLAILKLIAPIMPHITEEIYQAYFKNYEKTKSIHITEWPSSFEEDKNALEAGNAAIDIITKVRQFKSKEGKSLKTEIILGIDKNQEKILKPVLDDLRAVCNAKKISFGKFSVEFA